MSGLPSGQEGCSCSHCPHGPAMQTPWRPTDSHAQQADETAVDALVPEKARRGWVAFYGLPCAGSISQTAREAARGGGREAGQAEEGEGRRKGTEVREEKSTETWT